MKTKMTVQKIVLSMLDGINTPLTEKEYNLVKLSKFNLLKRREFSNLYKTVILYLTRFSIPYAFSENSKEILKNFEKLYQYAYQGSPKLKKIIDNDLIKFDELRNLDENHFFDKIAIYIIDQIEKRPRKAVFAVLLSDHLNKLFKDFVNIGNKVEVIYNPDESDLIEELKNKNRY
jgi:thymidine kinase